MKRLLFMALAMASMLHAGAPAGAATDVDTAARDTSHATGHAVSKTGHSIEKGASKTADRGEVSKLLHAIRRSGAQVGRLFDPSASYSRGAAVRNPRVP